jgi:acetyltransferase-like isoleucine patch superfamily enzyme
MSELYSRITTKLWSMWFTFIHAKSFKNLGYGSFLFYPFRVDGSSGIEIGTRTLMQRMCWLYCRGIEGIPASLKIGDGCVFGYNNHITSVRSVVIGNNVLTANNVYISDNSHGYENIKIPIIDQPVQFKKAVVIGDGSWIGENACIIGSSIGKNCVIGANAVVTHDIPDYSVAIGAPAVVIRHYDKRLEKWITRERV